MEKTVRLNADQREDLVAYLDGELPAEQAQQIDQILARSAVARHEVEALSRTWEMLDVLPSMAAGPEFTIRTMTNLKVLEEPFVLTEQWWFIHVRRISMAMVWLIAILGCASLGFEMTRHWIPNPDEQLLQDLPVIENLDQYQEADNMEFLIQLKNSGLFDEAQEK